MLLEALAGAAIGVVAQEAYAFLKGRLLAWGGVRSDREVLLAVEEAVRAERPRRLTAAERRDFAVLELTAAALARNVELIEHAVSQHPSHTRGPVAEAVVEHVLERAQACVPAGDPGEADLSSIEVPVEVGPAYEDPRELIARGVRFGGFRLEEVLGTGGFGTVYRARSAFGLVAAIKVAHRANLGRRLLREAQKVHLLQHPNIVRVEGGDLECEQPWLRFEYVDGGSLRDALRADGRLAEAQVLGVARAVLEALAYAHERGVLHLDVKPDNILLPKGRPAEASKLADFGIGRVLARSAAALELSLSLPRVHGQPGPGTHAYMAPEQAAGEDLDGRADLFALGVTIFECVRGRLPRGAGRLGASSEALNKLYAGCFADAPEDRFASAREALSVLNGAADEAKHGATVTAGEPATAPRVAVAHPRVLTPNWPAGVPNLSGMRVTGTEGGHVIFAHAAPGGLEIEMVYVPPGDFVMGADDGSSDEKPRHQHRIDRGYFIGRHPTTVGEFKRFVDATSYRTEAEQSRGAYVLVGGSWKQKSDANWRNPYFAQTDTHPVTCVSRKDAKAFCDWAGLALPTEPQWEKAARGTDGRTYPWGNEDPTEDRCVWDGHPTYGEQTAAPVGGRPRGASPYGAQDMSGNVWEWCDDLYDDGAYARYARGDLTPPSGGSERVIRGGSWWDPAGFCRAAYRSMDLLTGHGRALGFRPAKVAP